MRPGCHFRILATPDFCTFWPLRLPPLPPHLQRPLHMLRHCCTRSLRCPTRIFSPLGAFWAELWPVFYFAPHTHHPICALFGLPPVAAKLCTRVAMARICRIGPLRCCTRGLSWFGALWVELWQKVHFSIQPAATPLCHPLPLLPSPASPKRCAAASQSLAHARHARCGAARRVWAALARSEGPRAPLFTFHFSHTHAQHTHPLLRSASAASLGGSHTLHTLRTLAAVPHTRFQLVWSLFRRPAAQFSPLTPHALWPTFCTLLPFSRNT